MTESPRQRRTAASILEGIQQKRDAEHAESDRVERELNMRQIRVNLLQQLLDDAEKNGDDYISQVQPKQGAYSE